MTAIIGLTRLLADSPSEPLSAEQATQTDLIRGSAPDLLALVNDLLDLAKAEAGRLEPQWADLELRLVFGQLRGTLRAVTTNSDVELVVEEPARMASAGHLPPLLVTGSGTRYLEHRAPLLGVPARRPPDLEFTLPHEATLVLYTDDLIERRDADIDDGLRALAGAAAAVDADLDHFCRRLVKELATPHIRDDIAVVAVRRR